MANQYKILSLIDEINTSTYLHNEEILQNGYSGLYHSIFDSVDEPNHEGITKEVHDILSMFRTIDNSIATLEESERKQLDLSQLQFVGFDGNRDPHYHQTKFMVEKLGLYDELSKRRLNSHSSATLPQYQRQLQVFERVHEPMKNLTLEQLQKIAAA